MDPSNIPPGFPGIVRCVIMKDEEPYLYGFTYGITGMEKDIPEVVHLQAFFDERIKADIEAINDEKIYEIVNPIEQLV